MSTLQQVNNPETVKEVEDKITSKLLENKSFKNEKDARMTAALFSAPLQKISELTGISLEELAEEEMPEIHRETEQADNGRYIHTDRRIEDIFNEIDNLPDNFNDEEYINQLSKEADILSKIREGNLTDEDYEEANSLINKIETAGNIDLAGELRENLSQRTQRYHQSANTNYLAQLEERKSNLEYKKFVNKVLNGTLSQQEKSKPLYIGKTPVKLIEAGFPDNNVSIGYKVIEKAQSNKNADHNLSQTTLSKVWEALKNPIAVIKAEQNKNEKNENNRYAVILDLKDDNGHYVLAAFELNRKTGNAIVNDIRSIHSRKNYEPIIDKAINDGRLIKVDGDKIRNLLWGSSDIISEGYQASSDKDLLTSQQPDIISGGAASLIERIRQIKNNVNIYFQSANTAGAKNNEIEQAKKEWQEKGVESKYFKKWFGDSKVVDEQGKPLVVYHNTNAEFDTFDEEKQNKGFFGKGFYFSNNENFSNHYGKNTMPVYLKITKPYLNGNSKDLRNPEFLKNLKRAGYDGIIKTFSDGTATYVVFSPEQIKSVNNQGTFDERNANIYFQEATNSKDNIYQRTDKTKFLTDNEVEQVKKDGKNFVNKVRKFIAGELSEHTQINVLSKLPSAYNNIPALKGKKLVINQSIYAKIIDLPNQHKKNHNIDRKRAEKLPQLVADPLYILQSKSEGNEHRFVVVTSSKGNMPAHKLSVIINPNKNNTAVVSAYDETINISEEKKAGRVLYDKKRELSKTNATSKAAAIDNSNNILTDNGGNVKYHSQSGKEEDIIQTNMLYDNVTPRELQKEKYKGWFIPAENLIQLLKNGDESTIVHEFAHWWLDRLVKYSQYNEELALDLEEVRKFLKNDGGEFTRDQHEKFAAGFEAYIRSGSARSNRLKKIFEVMREFIDNETAKKAGRTHFNEMLAYLKKHKNVNIILAEKTDRFYRNFKDYVILDEFKGLEIHLVKKIPF